MTEEQGGAEATDEDGPSAAGRDEAEEVVEDLKENEDQLEEGSGDA